MATGVSIAVYAGVFSQSAHHKSYKDYYVTKSEELNGTGPKIAEAGKNGRRSDRHR